jgi:AcrR family transcriptional regulator
VGRAPGRPSGADAGKLRARIVAAAASEFADAGFRGARIENVARAAGCNRALVYFHFKSKAGLFEAVLAAGAEHRGERMAAQPQTLAEALIYWLRENMAEPDRIRLVMQEALADLPETQVPARRVAYLEAQLAAVKAFQAQGLLRSDIDARHLLTAILALTSFPAAFPRVAQVALAAADRQAMIEEWARGLERLAELLSPASESRPSKP